MSEMDQKPLSERALKLFRFAPESGRYLVTPRRSLPSHNRKFALPTGLAVLLDQGVGATVHVEVGYGHRFVFALRRRFQAEVPCDSCLCCIIHHGKDTG